MDYFSDLTIAEQNLRNKADLLEIPIAGTFELTPLCNMDCRMCYVRMSKKELDKTGDRLRSVEEWIELGRQAVEQGMMFLLLTGGEPFLYPDFIKVYHELRNMGLVIMINSNGTLLSEEILCELEKNKPRRINMSLYGSSDAVYEDLCCNPHGFSQVMESIRHLQERNIDIRFNMAITPWNRDDFPNMLKIAEDLNIPVSIANYIFPANRRNLTCEEAALHRYSPELAALHNIEITKLSKTDEEMYNYAVNKLQNAKVGMDKYKDTPKEFWCRGGLSSFWVSWNHKLLPCGMLQNPSINMAGKEFKQSWSELRNEMRKIVLSSKCYHCEKRSVCQTCAASMYTETGSFQKVPEYQCRLTDVTLEECKKIIEGYNHE